MVKQRQTMLRPCTIIWLLLLALTCTTYVAAQMGMEGKWLIIGVLFLALLKAQMVADFFMGLRRVGSFWRPVVGGYFVIVGGLIAMAFLLPKG